MHFCYLMDHILFSMLCNYVFILSLLWCINFSWFLICTLFYASLCASGGVYSPLDWPEEEWNHNIATNLTGLWLVSKYVCRQMRDAKQKGSVINISSIGGIHRGQLPGGIAYTASKAGVNAITKVIFLEDVNSQCWQFFIFRSSIHFVEKKM